MLYPRRASFSVTRPRLVDALASRSESLARDKNEEHAECGINKDCHCQDHDCSFRKKLANVRLADAREVEWRVLAEADECHDGVQGVLIGGEKVDPNGERQYEL